MNNINNKTYNRNNNARVIRMGMVLNIDVPYQPTNPHQHHGRHYYVVVSNNDACRYSPVLQVVPFSHITNRRLPCQKDITTRCLPKTSCVLAEQLTLMSRETLNSGRVCGILEDDQFELVQEAVKIQLAIA